MRYRSSVGFVPAGLFSWTGEKQEKYYEKVGMDENDNTRYEERIRNVLVFDHYEDQPASSGTPAPPKASSGGGNYEYGATTPTGKGDNSYWLEENEVEITACHKFDWC